MGECAGECGIGSCGGSRLRGTVTAADRPDKFRRDSREICRPFKREHRGQTAAELDAHTGSQPRRAMMTQISACGDQASSP